MKKITKKLINDYVFGQSFSANELDQDTIDTMYWGVQYAENHPNELTAAGIKKSHKMHYSQADKRAFVNVIFNNL